MFSDSRVGNGDVFIINADGSRLTNVTRSEAWDGAPSWSPDGMRLAFASDRTGTGLQVFVVDVDGSNLRRLTSQGGSGPVWSPDSRQIIFSWGASLYVMNADGSFLAQLTTPPLNSWDSAPAWRR